jgi:hypothetical protein
LSKTLPSSEFAKCISSCESGVKDLAEKWYRLDSNNVPNHYVLKDLTNSNGDEYWGSVLPTLRNALENCPCHSDMSPDILINRSVTEWEVKYALRPTVPGDSDRCLWFHRIFDGGVSAAVDPNALLCDVRRFVAVSVQDQDLNNELYYALHVI